MIQDLTPASWAISSLCGAMVGLSKTGLPGLGILTAPLMAQVFPPKQSTGVLLPMLIFADVFAVIYYRRHAVWAHLARLIPSTLAGIVAGYFALDHMTDKQVGPLIGAIVLALLAAGWARKWRDPANDKPWLQGRWAWAAGFLAGFTTMVANAAGPVMIVYLLAMRLPKQEFLGTSAWFFMAVNWIKVPFSVDLGLISVESLEFNLAMTPLIAAGAIAGVRLARRLPQNVFDATVQALAFAAALRLMF